MVVERTKSEQGLGLVRHHKERIVESLIVQNIDHVNKTDGKLVALIEKRKKLKYAIRIHLTEGTIPHEWFDLPYARVFYILFFQKVIVNHFCRI